MKKPLLLSLVLMAVLLMSSCATVKSPVLGALYTDVKAPFAVTDHTTSTKVGSAEATSILGLVATGDASIDAACRAGGITRIHHVDEHVTNILGIVAKYKVVVYGE